MSEQIADPAPLQSMVDRIRDQLANLTARHREEQVTLFFQPKPWWLPRPLWKYLLRRLTTVVFMREPPFALPPVTLSGWPSGNILREPWSRGYGNPSDDPLIRTYDAGSR